MHSSINSRDPNCDHKKILRSKTVSKFHLQCLNSFTNFFGMLSESEYLTLMLTDKYDLKSGF